MTIERSFQSPDLHTPLTCMMVPSPKRSREEPVMFLSGTLKKRDAGSQEWDPLRILEPRTTISRPFSLMVENQIARRSPLEHHVIAGWWLWL